MLDQKFWQKYFQVYDALNLFIPYQELLKKICDELEIKKGEKILEAGCGTCNLVLEIKKRGGEPIGLDNCPAVLDICRQKDPTLKLVLADLRKNLTFKIFYYNYFIQKESNYCFLTRQEQKQLFQQAGFSQVSESQLVYANQAIFNSAIK